MKVLAIDVGSFSIKFLEVIAEKKALKFINFREIVIDDIKDQLPVDLPLYHAQIEIIETYLKEKKFDGKIIFQYPSALITTRYFNLPVNNRKKAEIMLPFQLEEGLPYQVGEFHFATYFRKKGASSEIHAHIVDGKYFDDYQKRLDEKNVNPHILTTELAIIEQFCELTKEIRIGNVPSKGTTPPSENGGKKNFSYGIVDIGHMTTTAAFIENDEVVSNHISYTAGKNVTEAIASTYNISEDEAEEYKIKNCFLLMDNQFSEVGPEQAEFALLMKKTLWPLVQDIRRWEIGHRVKYGHAVDMIYLTGGSSQIKNICNFLTQVLRIKVLPISSSAPLFSLDFNASEGQKSTLWACYIMAKAFSQKKQLTNLLCGPYSKNFSASLPLHSTFFLAWRCAVVAFFLLIAAGVEKFYYTKENAAKQKEIASALKSSRMGISNKDQKKLKTAPKELLRMMAKKNVEVEQEINSIMSKSQINGLLPLAALGRTVNSNANVDLEQFNYDGQWITATFASSSNDELTQLRKKLESSDLQSLNITSTDPKNDKNYLNVKFQMNF